MSSQISQKVITVVVNPGSRFAASLARQLRELAAVNGGEVRLIFENADGTTDKYTVYPGMTLAEHAFHISLYPEGKH